MKSPSCSASLATWLTWLEHLHPAEIDLGLERVREVAERAGLVSIAIPIVLVGGTNGKGSVVEFIAQIYEQAGYRVGAYTSPHICVFNERVRFNGDRVSDTDMVGALAAIETVRNNQTLTYFEFTTLAAMRLFVDRGCEVIILEVGLGGRLDATNLWDAQCAIITSVAVDHELYLGRDRESIGAEKAAIGRRGKPLIVGDPEPPATVLALAKQQGMQLLMITDADLPDVVSLYGSHQRRNAACALMAINCLQTMLPVAAEQRRLGLARVRLAGRFERCDRQGVTSILDVAHNPAAAVALCQTLQSQYPDAQVHCVFAVLADKDIGALVRALMPVVKCWYCADLTIPRAAKSRQLAQHVIRYVPDSSACVDTFSSVSTAWQAAIDACQKEIQSATQQAGNDTSLVLVAGSFYTISALQAHWRHTSADLNLV